MAGKAALACLYWGNLVTSYLLMLAVRLFLVCRLYLETYRYSAAKVIHILNPICTQYLKPTVQYFQVMTYNVGYFFAVPSGLALGYVLFYESSAAASAGGGGGATRSDGCHVRLLGDE